MIYKKGKKHRVLVCPQCGILATNPFSFKRMLTGAATGAAAGAPIAGVGAVPGAIAGGIIGSFSGGKEPSETPIHIKSSRPYVDRVTQALNIRGS